MQGLLFLGTCFCGESSDESVESWEWKEKRFGSAEESVAVARDERDVRRLVEVIPLTVPVGLAERTKRRRQQHITGLLSPASPTNFSRYALDLD